MCTASLVEVYNGTKSEVKAPGWFGRFYDMDTFKKRKKKTLTITCG
jgi:hypothetical protein